MITIKMNEKILEINFKTLERRIKGFFVLKKIHGDEKSNDIIGKIC